MLQSSGLSYLAPVYVILGAPISKQVPRRPIHFTINVLNYWHSGLTGKLTKCVQYGINDLYLHRPGFYVPDISGSSRSVHKFVQVVTYRTLAK